MTDLVETVKAAVAASRNRIDFLAAEKQLREFVDTMQRDVTILDFQKRSLAMIVEAAIDALHQRHNSPSALHETLMSIEDTDVIDSLTTELLTGWYFHLVYRGHTVAEDTTSIARPIIARHQGDAARNKKKLELDATRYEWLAAHGPDPSLSRDNAAGLIEALKVLPLPSGVTESLAARAGAIGVVAERRCGMTPQELALGSLSDCESEIARAWRAHEGDPSQFLPQNESFCVRAALTSIEKIIDESDDLEGVTEEVMGRVATARSRLDQVGFRSSSAVKAAYLREAAEFELAASRSIDFVGMRQALREITSRARASQQTGRDGKDRLIARHAEEVTSVLGTLGRRVEIKRRNSDQLRQELTAIASEVERLEKIDEIPARPIKRLHARVGRKGVLAAWIDDFPDRDVANEALSLIDDLRKRLNILWERMESNEPARAQAFVASMEALRETIAVSTELPDLLVEVLDSGRALQDFSSRTARSIESAVHAVREAFRSKASDTSLLRRRIAAAEEQIERAHRRIHSPVEYDELFAVAGLCRRWVGLRDFPMAERAPFGRAVKALTSKIHELQRRQDRVHAEREVKAAELSRDLEADIHAGVSQAKAAPAERACWDELVLLNRRIGEAWKLLSKDQQRALRALLDEGFSAVRELRAAFAMEAERKFAMFHERISEIQFQLEESPTRESAFEAIDSLKSLRPEVRNETALMRTQRAELRGLLNVISQSIDEIFESADATSADQYSALANDIEKLEKNLTATEGWAAVHRLIAVHKELSAGCRDSNLSMHHRRQLRLQLDTLWEELAEKLQKYRLGRTSPEDLASLVSRLEQHNWLALVATIPRAV